MGARLIPWYKRIPKFFCAKNDNVIKRLQCTIFLSYIWISRSYILYLKYIILYQISYIRILYLISWIIGYLVKCSQRFTEVLRGSQRFSEVHRGSQRFSEVHRGSQRFTEAHRGSQRFSEVHRGSQRFTEVHRGSQRFSDAISLNQCIVCLFLSVIKLRRTSTITINSIRELKIIWSRFVIKFRSNLRLKASWLPKNHTDWIIACTQYININNFISTFKVYDLCKCYHHIWYSRSLSIRTFIEQL